MGPGKRLSAAFAAIYLIALPAAAQTPVSPKSPFALKEIGPGVYAAISGESNAGFIIGDDAVLVVDSFFEPDTARALLSEIRKITPKPIRYVVNTHYHADHVSGDQVFKDAGAIIVAHRNVRAWIRPENLHMFGQVPDPAFKAMMVQRIAQMPLPDLVTEGPIAVWLGARRVDIRPAEGHTGGDLVVGVPDAKVLFCGDLLWRKYPPNIIDGTVSKWIATVTDFQHLPNASAMTFVPGHGDVANVQDVADFDAYLTELSADVAAGRAAGLTGKDLSNAVVPKLKARFGDWEYLDRSAPTEVGYMDAELAGTKRVPIPTGD
jgi:glyoxylase-like metal-dependent hydrolase (beta-lactamase superfamily II)